MENRQLYISTAGTGIDYVTDDDWKEILNDIRDYATDGDYVQVCETYIDDVIFYAKWANSTFFTMFQSLTVDLIIGVVIAGIVVLVLRFSGKSEKTGFQGNLPCSGRYPAGIQRGSLYPQGNHFTEN